ncbi:hypothetical protein Dimus_015656 [Dionaea muscipula]
MPRIELISPGNALTSFFYSSNFDRFSNHNHLFFEFSRRSSNLTFLCTVCLPPLSSSSFSSSSKTRYRRKQENSDGNRALCLCGPVVFEFFCCCDSFLKRENGVWWLGSGENRRRDDEEASLVENKEVNEEAKAQQDFDWEAVIDKTALQGESGSDDKFYDVEVEVKEPVAEAPPIPVFPASPGDSTNVQKESAIAGVDPSAPTGSNPDSIFSSL